MNKPVEVNVSVISIHAKCSDRCFTSIKNEDGMVIHEQDGYVPGFMPGNHYGDYIILDIDAETGRILNWKRPDEVVEGIQNMIEHGD